MPLARTRITRFLPESKQALGADFSSPDNDNYEPHTSLKAALQLASLVSFQFMMNSPLKVAAIVPPVKWVAPGRNRADHLCAGLR